MQTWPRPLRGVASSDHGVQGIGHQPGIQVTAHALQAQAQRDVVEVIDAQARHAQIWSRLRSAREGFAVCHVINCV
jgi:hypothetical protein